MSRARGFSFEDLDETLLDIPVDATVLAAVGRKDDAVPSPREPKAHDTVTTPAAHQPPIADQASDGTAGGALRTEARAIKLSEHLQPAGAAAGLSRSDLPMRPLASIRGLGCRSRSRSPAVMAVIWWQKMRMARDLR